MTDAKQESSKMEETASSSLSSPAASFKEKTLEAEQSTREATRSPTPAPSVRAEVAPELKKVVSAKEAQAELTKIMTSGEGVEYPTGVKLNLISLALCLSVFLMALDNTIVSNAPNIRFTPLEAMLSSYGKAVSLVALPKSDNSRALSQISSRLQPLYQKLRINSTVYQTSVGMALRTCSQRLRSNCSSANFIRSSRSNGFTS
jgi:hypothetical protein